MEIKQQYNGSTGKFYEGKNQVDLQCAKVENGFTSDCWYTFLQARDKGLRIKKGSHGISIFRGFADFATVTKTGKKTSESRPLGYARVFNQDQTEEVTVEQLAVLPEANVTLD